VKDHVTLKTGKNDTVVLNYNNISQC